MSGRVCVNGQVCRRPETKIDETAAALTVAGREFIIKKYLYILLNKPAGVVSATRDEREKTVLDLLPQNLKRPGLFPAGRLDKDTTGMMIITDDGDFAHRLLAPKNHVPKSYIADIDIPLTESIRESFKEGIVLKDGTCLPAQLEILGEKTAKVTICEGRYHQIKRMFAANGAKVLALRRISMGKLELPDTLAPGQAAELTAEQIGLLIQKDTGRMSDK